MDRKFVRLGLSIMVALLATVGAFAAGNREAAKQTDGAPDLSKEVVLTGYFIGSQEEELPLVLAEFNKMLKADINAEFRIQTVGWGDRTSKFPLLFASGEPFDIVYVSAWHFFQDEAPKGTFLPLDDLLAKYAPNILKDTPKEYWDSVTYNGKIYAIPQVATNLDAKGIFYREDLRKKYGAAPIKTIEDWVAFMKVIAANDPTIAPFYDLPTGNVLDLYHGPNDIIYYGKLRSTVYRIADGKQFHNLAELPEYEKYVNFARQMYTQGLFPRNALANKTAARDFFKAGGAASVVLNFPNVITDQGQLLDSQPSWEVGFLPLDYDSKMNPESPINNAIAIYRGSKNPERAMMMMELIRSNRRYFQILANGIEGRHYINIGDNRWDFPAGKNANNVGYTGAFSWWGFLKGDFVLNGAKDWKFAVDLQKEYMESPRFLPYRVMDSFILDTASIQAELAALANVEAQYKVPLDWGVVDPADPVNGLPMLRRKLKEAGIDRVLAEYNKQLATHLAAKK